MYIPITSYISFFLLVLFSHWLIMWVIWVSGVTSPFPLCPPLFGQRDIQKWWKEQSSWDGCGGNSSIGRGHMHGMVQPSSAQPRNRSNTHCPGLPWCLGAVCRHWTPGGRMMACMVTMHLPAPSHRVMESSLWTYGPPGQAVKFWLRFRIAWCFSAFLTSLGKPLGVALNLQICAEIWSLLGIRIGHPQVFCKMLSEDSHVKQDIQTWNKQTNKWMGIILQKQGQ
jgi:hypothetical protein